MIGDTIRATDRFLTYFYLALDQSGICNISDNTHAAELFSKIHLQYIVDDLMRILLLMRLLMFLLMPMLLFMLFLIKLLMRLLRLLLMSTKNIYCNVNSMIIVERMVFLMKSFNV